MRPNSNPFSIVLGLLMTALTAHAVRGDFPDPDRLPAQADFPDPLVFFDGKRVETKEQWLEKRRPELKELFQHYMYGYLPKSRGRIESKVLHDDAQALGGNATLREIAVYPWNSDGPAIQLLLVVPNGRKGPMPVFVGANFCGNHALVDDPKVRIPDCWMYQQYPGVKNNRATEAGRGKQKDVWAIDQAIERGCAVATFYNGDVDPDQKDAREGMQPYFRKSGQSPATIAAWAWGIHRVVDFLVTQPGLDAKRIAVVGHSRLGKTALLAAAFDERIALAIPHQAGCGGTAPSRCSNPKAETVARINTSFPHWFGENFKKFNAATDKLPFDQHSLVALCAPRPVLFTNAVEDQWANPDGQFDVLKGADPVYRFLGAGGLDAKSMPETGNLSGGTLGYYIRPGKHSMTREDWKIFLDFADQHLHKTANVKGD